MKQENNQTPTVRVGCRGPALPKHRLCRARMGPPPAVASGTFLTLNTERRGSTEGPSLGLNAHQMQVDGAGPGPGEKVRWEPSQQPADMDLEEKRLEKPQMPGARVTKQGGGAGEEGGGEESRRRHVCLLPGRAAGTS